MGWKNGRNKKANAGKDISQSVIKWSRREPGVPDGGGGGSSTTAGRGAQGNANTRAKQR